MAASFGGTVLTNSRKAALFSCSVILLIVMCQAEVRHSRAERGHPNISAIGASPPRMAAIREKPPLTSQTICLVCTKHGSSPLCCCRVTRTTSLKTDHLDVS
jgi:hypothetical protein